MYTHIRAHTCFYEIIPCHAIKKQFIKLDDWPNLNLYCLSIAPF